MPLVSRENAETFAMHGVTFTSYARSATGATQLAAWRADFEPHTPGQAHRMSTEEVLHVLEGRLELRLGDEELEVRAGATVVVPAYATLCVSNAGDEAASLWAVTQVGMTATMVESGDELRPPWAQ